MAITGQGLRFAPLFWIFHDQWKYFDPGPNGNAIHNHRGHLHFFMPSFSPTAPTQDAFSGQQNYKFDIKDIWGPRSGDPNQSFQYTVVGKPKWFFHITELWRRVFIQPWDAGPGDKPAWSRTGVKYDASPADKTMGPFREGVSGLTTYAPVYIEGARSLPVDYFTSSALSQAARGNAVAQRAKAILGSRYVDEKYNLQHSNLVANDSPPGAPAFSDNLYIFPVLEYQKVIQLNWEPMPGSPPDVASLDDADETYGDGWSFEVPIPFINPLTGIYRSPFALQTGVVLPFGEYNDLTLPGDRKLIPDEHKLRYRSTPYSLQHAPDPALDLPPEKLGQLIEQWHNPWGDAAGGKIVQQCLGGVINARAKVIAQHKLGGRVSFDVTASQFLPTTDFAGTDQDGAPS
jgi:hypothetical protein